MVRIYLVQHGEAKPKDEDPERPLTERGRADVARVAEFARQAGVEPAEIRHSGKLRAEQTAEILRQHLAPEKGTRAVEGLSPNDDVAPLAKELAAVNEPLMIVGHLPFLAKLAGLLLVGSPDASIVRFRMGGIVCLERDDEGRWSVAWMITPDLLAAWGSE